MLASPQRNMISSSPSMETRCPSTKASVDSGADSRSAPVVSSTASSKGVELGARSKPTTNGKRGFPSSKRRTAHCRAATAACTISGVRSSVRLAGSGPSVLPSKSTSKRPAASIPVSHPNRVPQTRSRGSSPDAPSGGFPIVTLMTASLSQTSTKPTADSCHGQPVESPECGLLEQRYRSMTSSPHTHTARFGNRIHTSAAATTEIHPKPEQAQANHLQVGHPNSFPKKRSSLKSHNAPRKSKTAIGNALSKITEHARPSVPTSKGGITRKHPWRMKCSRRSPTCITG